MLQQNTQDNDATAEHRTMMLQQNTEDNDATAEHRGQ